MSPSLPAFAASTNNLPTAEDKYEEINAQSLQSLEELSVLSSKSTIVTDANKIEQLKSETLTAIESGEVKEAHQTGTLDFNQLKAVSINENNKSFSALSIPVINGEYSYLSNLTILFDDANKITMYSESLVSNGDNNCFKFDNYINGTLYESKQSEINYLSDLDLKEGVANLNKAGQDLIELQQKQSIPGQPPVRDLGKVAV